MITAIVRDRLPPHIDEAACRTHYERIAPGFGDVPGLLRKQFIWSERGIAGGVYQWTDRASAKRFYSGPWLNGIRQRYGAAVPVGCGHAAGAIAQTTRYRAAM